METIATQAAPSQTTDTFNSLSDVLSAALDGSQPSAQEAKPQAPVASPKAPEAPAQKIETPKAPEAQTEKPILTPVS